MDRTEQAREYIRSQRGRWKPLCEDAGLSYNWVMKFAQGKIESPSARLIDKVLAHQAGPKAAA